MNKTKLQAMMKCAYTNKRIARPALEGLAFKHEDGYNFMCVTDGYVLVYVPLPEDFVVQDRIIDPVAIKQYLITLRPKDEVDIKTLYELKQIDALYPNVSAMMNRDKGDGDLFRVDPRLLHRATTVLGEQATMTVYADSLKFKDTDGTVVIVMGLAR